jgi:hypothetical protein
MAAHSVVSGYRGTLLAGALVLTFPFAAFAVDNVPPEALNVKVFPDRYVAAGRPFADLAALEAWAKPIRIRTLWLDSCGPASTKQLLAAVERFQAIYAEGIQIRSFRSDEPGCGSAAESVSWGREKVTLLPAANEYFASDESGRSRMP